MSSCLLQQIIVYYTLLGGPFRSFKKEVDAFIPDKENIDDDLLLAKPTSGLQSGKL